MTAKIRNAHSISRPARTIKHCFSLMSHPYLCSYPLLIHPLARLFYFSGPFVGIHYFYTYPALIRFPGYFLTEHREKNKKEAVSLPLQESMSLVEQVQIRRDFFFSFENKVTTLMIVKRHMTTSQAFSCIKLQIH